mmetsp:Transcript_136184/g.236747  ORF Transcript_136184/g.236747 Transcript_136184/m.236747 type:complete len:427 (-) Transcript_136184:51-1331(-)
MSDDDSEPRRARRKRRLAPAKAAQHDGLWLEVQQVRKRCKLDGRAVKENLPPGNVVLPIIQHENQGETSALIPAPQAQQPSKQYSANAVGCATKAGQQAEVIVIEDDDVLSKPQQLQTCSATADADSSLALALQLQHEEERAAHADAWVHANDDVVALCLQRYEEEKAQLRRAKMKKRLSRLSLSLRRTPSLGPAALLPVVSRPASGRVLRLRGPGGKASPCVVVRDLFGDCGLALAQLLERHATGGIKKLKRQAAAHARGHPRSRRWISCHPHAPEKMIRMADDVRDAAARIVGDAALSPDSTDEDRRAAQKDLSKRGQHAHPRGLMYHPQYPGLCKHVDRGGGRYMVLFNLGLSCIFHCGTTRARKFEFEFRSGDAVVFNDGQSHEALHGMPRIFPASAPANLPHWLQNVRIGFQFRQHKAKAI